MLPVRFFALHAAGYVEESLFMTLALIPAPNIAAFNPPRRILMGPGPSDVYPTVLAAQSKPTVGHLDPLFVGMMDERLTIGAGG